MQIRTFKKRVSLLINFPTFLLTQTTFFFFTAKEGAWLTLSQASRVKINTSNCGIRVIKVLQQGHQGRRKRSRPSTLDRSIVELAFSTHRWVKWMVFVGQSTPLFVPSSLPPSVRQSGDRNHKNPPRTSKTPGHSKDNSQLRPVYS